MSIAPLSGLFLITVLCSAGDAVAAPILSIVGPGSVTQGDTGVVFTVRLDDTNTMNIGGADVLITFDTAALQFVDDLPGNLVNISNPPDPFFDDTFSLAVDSSSHPGSISILLTKSPFAPITGSGSLAILEFDVLPSAPPSMTFAFDTTATTLIDNDTFSPVGYSANDFTLTIDQSAADVSTPAGWALLPLGLIVMRRLTGNRR